MEWVRRNEPVFCFARCRSAPGHRRDVALRPYNTLGRVLPLEAYQATEQRDRNDTDNPHGNGAAASGDKRSRSTGTC